MTHRSEIARSAVVGMVLAVFLSVSGCSGTQEQLQLAADRNWLSYAVGQPYAQIAAQKETTMAGLFGDQRAYGDMFAATDLPNGDRLYRHLNRYKASTTSTSVGLLVNSDSANYSYRLLYFRVSPDGIIREVANGYTTGDSSSCVGWVAGIFTQCKDQAALQRSITSYDSLVRTSKGEPLSSWGV